MFLGKISKEQFGSKCIELVEAAEKTELSAPRGFFGNIAHTIKNAVKSFCGMNPSPTDSMQKMIALKKTLKEALKDSLEIHSENNENDNKDFKM